MLQNLQEAHNTAAAVAAVAAVVAVAVTVAVVEVHDIVADYHLHDLHAHGHFLFALQNGRVSFDLADFADAEHHADCQQAVVN